MVSSTEMMTALRPTLARADGAGTDGWLGRRRLYRVRHAQLIVLSDDQRLLWGSSKPRTQGPG